MHKTEMHMRIHNGAKGICIWLSEAEFQNAKLEEDEMQIGQKFYDIIRATREGNLLRVEAILDSKEEVFKDLQKSGRGKNMLLHLAKIFTPLFIPEPTIQFPQKKFDSSLKHQVKPIGHLSQFYPQMLTAPPDDIL